MNAETILIKFVGPGGPRTLTYAGRGFVLSPNEPVEVPRELGLALLGQKVFKRCKVSEFDA